MTFISTFSDAFDLHYGVGVLRLPSNLKQKQESILDMDETDILGFYLRIDNNIMIIHYYFI